MLCWFQLNVINKSDISNPIIKKVQRPAPHENEVGRCTFLGLLYKESYVKGIKKE
jgi:hypothetical protein